MGQQVLECIYANDKKAVYRHIVKSDADVNAVSAEALSGMSSNPKKSKLLETFLLLKFEKAGYK